MKTTRTYSIKSKLGLAATLGALLVGTHASAFTTVDTPTGVIYSDTVTLNNNNPTVIALPELDLSTLTTYEQNYWNAGLGSVIVTVYTQLDNANVQVDNDDVEANTANALVLNLVNTFSVTGVLANPLNPLDLQINEAQSFDLAATSGDTVGAFNATGDSDYDTWSPGTLQGQSTGSYDSATANALGYANAGTITFSINSTFSTGATFDGPNGFFQGNTPTGTYFASVEYIVIPEPGTLAMTAIALGSFGGITLLRRRKRA